MSVNTQVTTTRPTARTNPNPSVVDAVAPWRPQEHQLLGSGRQLLRKGASRKRFDSGDWCLARVGLLDKDSMPLDVPVEQLSPKLHPEPENQSLPRSSQTFKGIHTRTALVLRELVQLIRDNTFGFRTWIVGRASSSW